MADDEEYEEVVEYYTEETVYEEVPGETITKIIETTTTRTIPGYDESETSTPALAQPEPAKPTTERKKVIRKKVDSSKFMTPYIEHSQKMQNLFSPNKYKENYEKAKGQSYASTTDTPELRRIKKVQDQLSEVKYRMDGDVAKTICHVDEKAKDIEHAKKVSQQVSKVLYKQNWEDTKDKYLLPPDAPELVQAIKNTAMFSKKLYTEDWDADKSLFYPYNDSPELRRVAQAQKALSDVAYKKGHAEQQSQFTPLADPPDIEFAKKVTNQVSKQKYKEDYENKVKGKWSETPCFEIATARMNADNLSTRKYQEDFENMKDQIYFMQTETPEYKMNKQAGVAASKVKYKEDYEKNKGKADYNVLPASDNPLLRQLKAAGNVLSDKLYKENYEKTKAKSINYCETPKFKLDTVLHNFSSDTKYKDSYLKNILGHYVGSFEDPYHSHCMKVTAQNSDKNYKAEYEEDRGKGFFPQTITQEYEAIKKLDQCKDHTYKVPPDKTKFTQVTDSPVLVQAQVNSKQLSDLNYKAKHENEKFKCHIPPDTPAFIQHKVNAYNLSDNVYKQDWEKSKAKKFDIKVDAIPLLAAKANSKNASDVMYKRDYEKSRGKMIGALSINDDPKMLHSLKTAKNQSDRLYKENYEKTKAKSMNYCETPKYQLDTLLKSFSEAKYKDSYVKNILGHYVGSFEDPYHTHCLKVSAQNSDKSYKAEYEEDKGKCYFPQTITQEYEAIKKLDQCKDHTYKVHPDKTKFTAVTDTPVLLQAQLNSKQLSDLNYKAKHESEKFKCNVPADAPQFIQHRVNAYNLSDNIYKQDWEKSKAKKFDIKVDAIPLLAAKANSKNASDVMYKRDYEKSRGKMIGALSINDDPKMLHSLKTAKNQSDREYRKDYEKSKTIYTAPLDMVQVTQAKKSQEIASDVDYRHILHNYSYPPDSIHMDLAKKAYALQSDVEYKADYNSWMKGCGWVPFGSLEMEKAKRASDILNEKKYRQHPDTLKFTSIEDAPITVQSKINQAQRSDIAYKAKGEEILHKYSLPADLPQFIQAKVNAYNISESMYKADLKDLSKKGYDLRTDAIPIKAAKAARQAASDVQYKKDYEKAKGKMVGFQSLQDDPKLVHYMNVAKIQSDREYKKDYEKTKTKYNTPHDMFNVVAAKKAQDVISNVNYKHSLHHYTYLPDAMDLELSKNMMHIQSDNTYKEDYNTWMKGIGWIPIGSLDVEKVKKAGDALNEKKYRQHPDTLKFTSIVDSPVMVQAKQNTQQVSDILYKAKGEDVKHKYTISPDLPQFLQAKCNAYNISDVCYKRDWHDLIAKGNNVLADAIPITAAKSSRNIASDYKYKEAYEKAKGKHVGFRSLQDDPKLVHYMNVAKLQSDREYKKNYENTKTSYHTPGDMVSITAAKMAQDVATNVNYKQPIHHYTYLPDAMSLEHTRNVNQIQSDNVYKDEYNNFFKGIGWIPIGSLEVEKAKKAGDALNERKYRQHPDTIKFTSVPDSMGMVLAQQNTKQISDLNYKVEGEKVKHKYTIDPDLPQFIQAKVNAINMSDAHYKADWKKTLAKGYDLRADAIPIVAAKSSRNIASDCKYKEAHEKARGKQIGFLSLQDDPKLVHYMNVAKIQSDREYKKGYEASKTHYHTPLDMFSVTAAKKSQEVATNTNYRQPFHNYTLLPDALGVEHSRNAMQIQSDNLYKSDFTNWMKGIGWVPIESLEVEKAKKAGEILSEKKYRQHPEKLKFTYAMDTMEQALNKSNKLNMDKKRYTEKWNKDKMTIHVMPDTPDILLSRVNQITMSDKLYKAGWEEEKKKGYDLRPDAISIKAARASRDIASDYKYKQAYEQAKGKHIGFRSLEDDPKLVHFMQVAKMQSDREYKKGYEKSKTSFHTPVDMVSVVAAKKSQEVATNANYRNIIHTYNMLPDAMSFELAKNMMQIQSDNQYKADYADFMKGIGWLPLDSLEAEKNKRAMEIISEKKYRQHPDTLKYSTLMDSMNMVLAQNNAKIMNEHLYKQAWEADKTKVHIMPDIPEIILAKANAINMSNKLYKLSLEESKKKGYDLRTDAIPIKAAKASRDIASDYKYKYNYEKERGKMVGFRSLEDDPKLVHSMQVAKMQSDREYKKNYEKTKTSYHTPADMLSVTAAKDAQANITNTNYKHLIHKYILLPDAMNIELTRNMNHIQSNNEYKQDYNEWYKGLGWSPAGSLEVEKAKKATEYASDQKYRQHPSNFQFKKLNDSMDMVLAKQNAHTMNKHLYTVDWNKDKTKIHVMPDTPDILQAKQNRTLYSQKLYKLGWEEALKKGYDLPVDAISVQLAKTSRDIASDFKYKQGYRKQLGHHIGFRSLQDDPKLVLSMNVAKMQSEREYKKDFEKWKTKYTSPVDMLGVVLAKKCQALVSDVDYRHHLHQWTCLPDQNDVIQAKKVYELQSENLYKSDLEWLKGIGWSPLGSLEAEKNKRASEIISEKKYRQPPDRNKFTSIPDAMDIVLAKTNAKNRSDRLYREAWDKDKTQIHIMPDTPDIVLAKANLINTSDKLYRMGYEELKKKGYDLPVDAIPIKAAKASREIASEYKYKEGFRKQLGHHIGARNIKDDPKMMWSMHVAKIQSDREYKKDFEKWKTKFSSPVDMLGVVLAKKCQTLVSDVDYKHHLHQWTCLPDQNDVTHARQAYDLQSDNLYKSDLNWLKGIGWIPTGSLEDEKNKRATQILSDHVYRQHPDKFKFSSLMDSIPMVLAKNNAITMNHHLYTEGWNKDKTSIHIMPDTPEVLLAKQNKINYSEKLYKLGLEEARKKGYDMRLDAIPIKAAKASRDIASDFKYKEGYRKQLGHHIGARAIHDDPKMMWSMHVAKIQSDREYKKDFEKWKTKFSSPVDMLGVVLAKKCQTLVSDVDYKHHLHQWTCLPDQNDVIHARQAYDLQSDNMYKSDLQWLRGIGWVPIGSLDVEKCKRATEILSDKIYRQPPDKFKFTSVTDSLEQVLAKNNAITMNKRLYTEAWDKDKTQIHIMPDTPEIMLARMNKINYSESLYKLANEEAKKKGYDLRSDAIPIVAAKASRDIASDYKYKVGYRKQLGHHIGARNIEDDPKMMWSMHVAKIQSDREYKKDFEKWKTKFSSPVDMLGVVLAKKCQTLVSDVDYKHHLHQWTCLPDQNDVIHARQAYDLQSDNIYKSDLQWLRGIGWVPIGSLDVIKCKRAAEILSDNIYRQPPDKLKFTSVPDSLEQVLAKSNALNMNKRLYTEAWDKDKTQIHIMPDTPEIMLARQNKINYSESLYRQAMEEAKKEGYDLRSDAIPIVAAKASRDIASDYKYKEGYRKQLGHHIGARAIHDDPKMMWSVHVAKMQSDREYKKEFEKYKTRFSSPVDMLGIVLAKKCQTLVSDVDYKHLLHEWTCLPDQNDVIQARKAYDLQSDNLYKSDLEWMKGIGWVPIGSLEVLKAKRATEILSDNIYRQRPDALKFTSVTDSLEQVLAKNNALNMNKRLYIEAWENDKKTIHVMPDTPEIMLAKLNRINYSDKLYKLALEESKKEGYDLRVDAIPIQAAKASRDIASDYKYKEGYRKQLGHHIGARNIKDDPKMMWSIHVAKIQSDREYKKDFEKWKTKFSSPVDMLGVVLAKKCQILVSDIDYKHPLHEWTCLPDQNDVIQARKAYDLQSDAVYKADLEWLRGIGWMPNDSVSVNHAKHAADIFSEKKYRTKIETLNFTPVDDRVDYVTAKQSGEILNDIKYRKDWNDSKSKYTLTETPLLHTAQEAARILDQYLYKEGWEKQKATGYILPPDAVPFVHAHHSGDVQSELKYKAEHVKQKGHYVGVPTMRDDPKLVWFEHAGQIQNERLYKQDYHKTKAKINIPADMVSVLAAKQGQGLVSDIDYRNYLHQWTCHPDQNDVIQARKAYDLQSDNVYKSDLEWLRGIGWIPLDSVDHVRVTKNQEMVNQIKYKKEALDNYPNFTSVVDPPEIVLAKINAVNQSDVKYKETFNKAKGKYTFSPDTPYISHSKDMGKLYSTILYKGAWEGTKAYGYTLDERYIPIVGAKHADLVNSELKYKETYEKQKGHYLAGKVISEFPSVVHCLDFQQMRSALNYRKHYEDTKANVHIPNDMLNHVLAKRCQYILSDLEYRHYFHQWTSLPEEPKFMHARNAQEILSDNVYKDDLNWLRGIGCYVWDTPQILHAKKSYDLQSQIQYTAAGKENLQNYNLVTDTPVYVTALQSGINASEVKYKENYHQIKDKYTTVLETVDYDRTKNLKSLYSSNLYKEAWDKVKATSYILPTSTLSLTHAKSQKHLASHVKYREEYEKFKALYTLPKSVEDDPNTARCLRVGKFNIDRLYRSVYEKNKMKIHTVPDMVEMVTAKDTQKKVSEVDYRLHLHEWICHPDLQVNSHVRKVTDQISDIVYKDDLTWLKGIGCYVWDTPEILHAKHAYDLRNDIKYKAHVMKTRNDYHLVTDTPVYVQAVQSGKQLSDAVYHYDYVHSVRGKVAPTTKTVDLDRALHAYKLQSENLYKTGLRFLPTGYRLPVDTPHFKHNKDMRYMSSYFKYKEVYEHIKANGYTLGPKDVPFVHVRRVNNVTSERLYRELYHKLKDKIHTTPDTPEIRQVKKTQEAVSELIYKSDFFKMQGHMISLPYTPQVLHCRYVGDITSDIKYKEDLQILRGLGCFLYDTPDMVRSRHLKKLWSNYLYTDNARKMRDKYQVVLDTPEYRKVQELKTHLSELVYRASGKKQKSIFTSVPDTPDLLRAKRGQKLQSQYLYVELATKERPHHHAGNQTTALKHAKDVKDMVSEKKYKIQYEKMKDKYTPVPDTPILIRAKRAYWNASDLRYKETFQKTKGRYHTVKDALDIVYHRKVTDDISKVKYKEKYMSQLGIWRSIPDHPEHFHHRAVTDAVSDVKYKEDLTWLKGIGCYAYDTPDFTLAEQNKTLYSKYKYKEVFERTKSNFKYVADCPINRHFKYATQLMNEKKYRADYEQRKDKYHLVVDEPRHLLAKTAGDQISQIKYRKNYEKSKDKFTSVVDTPEHLRTTKVNKQISDILYKLEYNKAKPRGYTTIHDTPMLLHVRKVKDEVSDLKYKEVYQRNKSNCTIKPDAVHIKAAKDAYKVNTNLDYKKLYESNKAYWKWTPDRPDFIQAAKASLQQSDFEYKLDREFLKGCKLSVTDDKDMVLALRNSVIESDLKYKEKHVKERGTCHAVPDTPQVLLAKTVSSLVSENKYKSHVKKHLAQGSYTTLPETRDTVHVKKVTKHVSDTNYKKKFVKEKGKSNYSIMQEPPEVKHAMEVAKKQSDVAYKKDAKENLHYTTVADRPDIKKATQAAKQASEVEYRAKHRKEGSHGLSMLGRPDIEMAKKAARLSSQIKYRENFDKEKGKAPKYNPKDSQLYKTMKDANNLASEVKYKADLKKLHKPVTDMKESLIMNHVLNTSQLASSYQYKKNYEKSKGHYHTIPDNLEQLHLKEATELQSIVKYKEKYEKERGKPMLDFETPTYITAKESQQMQSGKEYRKDYEESIKGRNLTGLEVTPALLHVKYATKIASEREYRKDLEESIRGKGLTEMEDTPDMVRAKNATQILNEKEYKRDLELEVKGRGLNAMANETPDFMRAKNATDIASQIKYKQSAEMEKANFTSVVDTPEIIHAQQVKNLSSQKKYKEDAEKSMSYYETVLDTPEMQRVRENQKNFSLLQYQCDLKNSKGKITVVQDTPEILRVKENQKNFSSVLYKEDVSPGTAIGKTPEMMRVKKTQDHISSVKYKEAIGQGTPIPDLPEVKRVKETQKHISSVMYKENLGTGIPTTVTPEIERVKRNQENFSSVLYKENLGKGTPTAITPEMERVKRNQENFSSILYKENLSKGTPLPVTPEMERVKRNQENFSSVLYKENLGKGIAIPITPEMERVKHNQENFSSVLYKENLGTGIPIPITPEMQRIKHNQENISSVLYKENMGKGTPLPVTPEMERVKHNQENISSVLYKENVGKATPTPVTPEMQRVKRNQENISSVLYKENMGKATPTPFTPEMERVKRNQENFSSVLYKENMRKATATPVTPEMERAKRNQENISSVLYSDSFRKQIQGKAAYVLDTPEMRRVRETQRHISTVKYHEDFEKHKGCFTPVVTDPITERVKKNTQDFSDINYRGIQRKVVEMEQKRNDQDQETITGLRVWRTNPGSVFDYDPAEDNIQSRSLHMINAQAHRRSREQSRSASALSISGGEEKSEHSEAADHRLSTYSDGGAFFSTTSTGYRHVKTTELPQQRSSSVATQQTTLSSIPSHPSTAGKIFRAMYDYMAADADEVSFKDGDAIVNVQAIDEGWMYGTVQRTGRTGMLPANYVEAI
ncbi:nebulin isoform X39 [Octodon degus]|uniref:Nebulin isoform X39 n=1 Tax=Octodon degus TaxID=10160 RepID=A0A6P6EXW1_OCTDE|nr:nebulin isoform X39 [Octodon degus]